MRVSKKNIRKKSSLIRMAVYTHVQNNIKNYVVLSLIFIIGVMLGVIVVNNTGVDEKQELCGHISGFITSIKSDCQIDTIDLLKNSIVNNVELAVCLWILSSTIIGIVAVYGIVTFKGFCIGYTTATVIATLGTENGILFSITSLLLQNLIFIPCVLALGVSGMRIYKSILKDRKRENIKVEIYRHTAFTIMITIGLIFSSFIETYISSPLLMETIKYI